MRDSSRAFGVPSCYTVDLLRDACAFVVRAYAHLLIGLLFLIALTLPLVIVLHWLGV